MSFQRHNLVSDPHLPLLDCDLILCRNVLIYFSSDVFRRVINRFTQAIASDGWLLVGHAEPNTEMFSDYRMVSVPGAILYQRGSESEPARGFSTPPIAPPVITPSATWQPPVLAEMPLLQTSSDAGAAIFREYASPPAEPLDEIRKLADAGQWESAASACEALLATQSLQAELHFYYGLVLQNLGKPKDGEQALRRAIYLDRNFALAHFHLGLHLQSAGDLSGAARAFANILRILDAQEPHSAIAAGGGMTAGELRAVVAARIEALNGKL